ncbi:MAG: hypothetical protein CWE10_14640 [Symbiobacterium thermophilum]|uniref:Conserved domain protein n=2 Tax=Symbiobacterium thermophilum TaxID=2734 RepID=Q67R05_SYMTH|nr:hypothetical protein [Symbiobacterium thermophilum]BAD39888.1 conserved domain protein [Symbiobacterium thermophilum IAM 14863]
MPARRPRRSQSQHVGVTPLSGRRTSEPKVTRSFSTRQLTRLSLLTAAGLALALLERQLPPPAPVPGVRWGLANAATLAALALDGPAAGLLVWFCRFILAQIFAGTLFGPAFFVGGAGGLLAWAAMALFARGRRLGPAGVSAAGAVAHHVGQLAAAAAVTSTPGVLALLPLLLVLGPPVGLLTGALVGLLLRRLEAAGALGGAGAGDVARATAPDGSAPRAAVSGGRSGLIRASDLALAGGVAVLAGALVLGRGWWAGSRGPAAQAVVTVAGAPWRTLDLRQDGLYPVEPAGGHLVVEVADGAVRVREADCPDQVCVLTGWISSPGDMIVCVPYRVVIQITGDSGVGPDAILR